MRKRQKLSAIFKSSCPRDTARLAAVISGFVSGGEVFSLSGTIGAGKTFFVKELAAALGAKKLPVSASFNIMRTYTTRGLKIYHFDLFRVCSEETDNLGLEDFAGRTDGITAVEWGEPAGALWSRHDRLDLDFTLAGGDAREITASAFGDKSADILAKTLKIWRKK